MMTAASRSLRARLLAAAVVAILGALLAAGIVLVKVFERHVDARLDTELENHLRQIVGLIDFEADGSVTLSGSLADPRFALPYSGLYWQIEENGRSVAASPSLGEDVLSVSPPGPIHDRVYCVHVPGPLGRTIIVAARDITVSHEGKDRILRLATALDEGELHKIVGEFRRQLLWSLGTLGAALLAAAWAQVMVGLAPLALMRRQLADVRGGAAQRVGGQYPEEVNVLVQDLNTLLDRQDKSLVRARSRAGELAHGLKTPLTALNSIARDLTARGDTQIAGEVTTLVQRMQGHVERELARTRIAGRRLQRDAVPLQRAVAALQTTLQRMPRGDAMTWHVLIDAETTIAMDRNDLDELLGNLLDNAQRWAHGTIRVTADGPRCTMLMIEDDGPGIDAAKRDDLIERGATETRGRGHAGLGLAIVTDLLDAYGYGFKLERSDLGGLCVLVTLPTNGHG